ncbi:g4348 [Coccomyxa elongata]
MGKKALLAKKPLNVPNIKKFFDRKINKREQQPLVIDLSQVDNDDKDSTHTHAQVPSPQKHNRSPSPHAKRLHLASPTNLPASLKLAPVEAVADDYSEDQRVVYRDSPRHEDCSGQQHSRHSTAANASGTDLDLIRQRLISAVQRPHAPSGAIGVITGTPARRHTTPSADPLSLRPDASRAAGTGTPRHGGAAPPAGRSAGSATPSRKSTSKTPSEQLRSGSAVKRKFAPVGGQLAASPGSVRPCAAAARTASGLHRGSSDEKAAGPSTRKRQASRKRRALLDILEQVEVVVQGHKEDSAEEGGVHPSLSLSTSFERASQEIERASQDLASVRRQASQQHSDASLHDMVDIPRQTQPLSAAAGPIRCQALSTSSADAPLSSVEGRGVAARGSSQGGRIAGVGHSSGDVHTGSTIGQENRGGFDGNGDVQRRESAGVADGRAHAVAQPPADGSRPEQVQAGVGPGVDLWAADDGEDDWDADLAQLISSAAALRPAPDGPAQPPQPQPAAGPSGRSAAAPAGPAAYACARPHPTAAPKVGGQAAAGGASREPPVCYTVLEVHEMRSEKVLRALDERTSRELAVQLRDGWMGTPVQPGDTVHVLAHVDVTEGQAHAVCDHAAGLLVVQPDVLLSGTRVAGSFKCARQAVLEERFGGNSGAKAVEGTLLHELFQIALVEEAACWEGLAAAAAAIVQRNGEKLLEVGLDEAKRFRRPAPDGNAAVERFRRPAPDGNAAVEAMALLHDAVPAMLGWLQRFWRPAPDGNAAVEVPRAHKFCAQSRSQTAVCAKQVMALLHDAVPAMISWLQRFRRPTPDGNTALEVPHAHDFCAHSRSQTAVCAKQATALLHDAVPAMLGWLQRFRRPTPDGNAALEVPGNARGCAPGRAAVAVAGVADIEESVWAPRYGLKGMIDASVHLLMQPVPEGAWQAQQAVQACTAPLEFKTGKPHQSHRAQVTLYQLLMEERYGEAIEAGLLWYLNQASPEIVTRSPYEVAGLMMQRNALAARLGREHSLPPMLREERSCSNCFQRSNCALLHKALDGGCAESAGMGPTFAELTGHLSAAHAQFLAQWLRLVDLEEGDTSAKRSEIWAMAGEEREALGRCVAGLQLTAERAKPPGGPRERGTWLLDFRRSAATSASMTAPRLEDSCLNEGDMVIISVEGQHVAVARGVVVQLSGDSVTLSTDKPLPPQFAWHLRGAGGGGGAPGSGDLIGGSHELEGTRAQHSWRLDKDEVASVFVRLRRNLMGLFSGKSTRARRLRQLIVDLEPPLTGGDAPEAAGPAARPAAAAGADPSDGLNAEQRRAVDRVLVARDYTLILGMPGTGKTSTIVAAVKRLVAQGSSVLIMAYTNSAVDNVLGKLVEGGVDLLRLGRPATIHPALRAYIPGGARFPDTSVAGLSAAAQDTHVVGCTCLSVGHPLLVGRSFDVCILDEAGQVTLPAVLGALGLARSFCLVGDHYQLPPLVQCKAAAAGGLDRSLFRRLCEAHPQALITLRSQYRMSADIMAVANALVYNGELRCGSAAVAEASLQLPRALPPTQLPQWLQQVLTPERRVLWLDTDGVPGPEARAAEATTNATEAVLAERIVAALADSGVPLNSVGIISPYRSQVALVQRLAIARGWDALEVLTVDKCQGRDKDAIIVSLVRSNEERSAGKLLADWRRINVALTRPKRKLVIIASPATLAGVPVLASLWRLCCDRGWAVPLPLGAAEG